MANNQKDGTNKTRVYAPKSAGNQERPAGDRRAKPFARRQDSASYDWVYPGQPDQPLFVDLTEALEEDEGEKTKPVKKKADKPKKKSKAKKTEKPPRDWKNMLSWVLAAAVALGIMAGLYFVFLLDTVAVEGNEQYADASIVELSGLRPGTHMLFCDLDGAAESIEQNPYLKVLSIKRSLPRTIVITLRERRETAAIRSMDYDVIIDQEGYVLSIGSGSELSGLLNVYGISVTGFQVGKPIGESTDYRTNALLSIFSQMQAGELMEEVTQIDLSNTMRVTLKTREGVTVLIGQPEGLEDKLRWMQDGLASLRKSGITGGTLDVSARGGAIYSPDQNAAPQNAPDDSRPEDGGNPDPGDLPEGDDA